MKKNLLTVIGIVAILAAGTAAFAKNVANAELTEAIKLYKAGNYSQCYVKLDDSIKKDPSNPLAYYYKGMTAAQIGKKEEAIENYDRALSLAPSKSNLVRYAEKGKRCLENPNRCQDIRYDDQMDEFIRNPYAGSFSDEARSMFERLKIEQMMREMNRRDEISPQEFRGYKDFSSMNTPSDMPTSDEIANAVRTLQKAGMVNFGNNTVSDLSLMTGANNDYMLNLMGSGNMNPQLIQALFTNNMSLGF